MSRRVLAAHDCVCSDAVLEAQRRLNSLLDCFLWRGDSQSSHVEGQLYFTP